MSKYAPLNDYLNKCEGNYVKLTFDEIERILSFELTSTASTYEAWWGNDKTHVGLCK
ncbi:TPA: hypothetical protein QCY13_001645 [Bacillus paranthracis]|nr:hypothetical protein [Bacillus paranthracis]